MVNPWDTDNFILTFHSGSVAIVLGLSSGGMDTYCHVDENIE